MEADDHIQRLIAAAQRQTIITPLKKTIEGHKDLQLVIQSHTPTIAMIWARSPLKMVERIDLQSSEGFKRIEWWTDSAC